MTTIVPPRHERLVWETSTTATAAAGIARYAWVAARLGLGFIFLWAFLDKLFGLGYATKAGRSSTTTSSWPPC